MKKYLALVSASIATAAMLCAVPAMAHDDLNWSVTVGSSGYPPRAVYSPPQVVYERPQPVYVERRAVVRYGDPYVYREGRRDRDYRDHDRYERHERRHHHRYD